MIAEYLAIVRPVEIFFSSKFCQNGEEDLRDFLWSDYKKGIWSGSYLSDLLKQYTSRYKLHGFGFQEYRQVAVAFMEKHLKFKVEELENTWDTIYDLQAGQSSKTTGIAYAIGSTDHRSVSRDMLFKFFIVSKSWYELLLGKDREEIGIKLEMKLY